MGDIAPIQQDEPADLTKSQANGTGLPPHIVVVGGGAAGLELVTQLGDRLGKRGQARITLVESTRTHFWKPLLHALAAGAIDRSEHELNYLAQAHWHHFSTRLGSMVGLDRASKRIYIDTTYGEDGREVTPRQSLTYDVLVIAIGSITNDFGTPGAAEHAVPLDTTDQASRFNRLLIDACIRANAQAEPIRPGQLHIAIVGAGATGTELAAELHSTVRHLISYGLDRIDPARDIKIVLIEAAGRILPGLSERISESTAELLRQMGIEMLTGTPVSEVRGDGIQLADGRFVPAELVVWSAGVKAPDFLKEIDGLETNRINQLVVTPFLQTTRDPDIFAIGDCAACPREGFTTTVPPRAQAAHQQASHMLKQIRRRLDGKPLLPYRYRDFGSLVSLGRHNTIGNLMGGLVGKSLFIEGLFARLMYRSLYKMHEVALYGWRKTILTSLARNISQGVDPPVKLH
jgi:NADH dehydrogenase